jgi:hypothetical protein
LRAQRVIYIEEGPVLDALRRLYTTAHGHLTFAHKDDSFAQMAVTSPVTSKVIAGIEGEAVWSNLLTLYEYLAVGENAYQSEWRIVQPLPFFGYAQTTQEIIASVSPAEGWGKVTGIRTLRPPDDVITGFVCKRRDETALRQALPSQFSKREIGVGAPGPSLRSICG